MMKLHQLIKNVYIHVLKPFLQIEILADNNAWGTISTVNITDKQQFFKVVLS